MRSSYYFKAEELEMMRSPRSGYVGVLVVKSIPDSWYSIFLLGSILGCSWSVEKYSWSLATYCGKYGRIVHEPEMVCVWLCVLGLCL